MFVDTVTPQELAFADGVAGAAAKLKGPTRNPEGYGLAVEFPDGEVQQINFTDNPYNRAMFAIREEFGGGAKFRALSTRVSALHEVYEDPRIAPYIREAVGHPDMIEVKDVVIEVAATLPIELLGQFDLDAFFAEVEKRVADSSLKGTESDSQPTTES